MNEPNKTVDPVMPPQGRACVWWSVRPRLQAILVAEVLAVVALFNLDATSAAIARAWFRVPVIDIRIEHVQAVITALAVVSVIAVAIEAVRKARSAPRRNAEGLKVASA
jgi:hypothetical protein